MYQINDCVFLCLPASIKDLDPERKDRIRIRPCLNSWELNKTAKPTKSISKTRKQCRFCLPGWICTFFSDFWSQSSIFLTIWAFWNSWRYYTFLRGIFGELCGCMWTCLISGWPGWAATAWCAPPGLVSGWKKDDLNNRMNCTRIIWRKWWIHPILQIDLGNWIISIYGWNEYISFTHFTILKRTLYLLTSIHICT